VVAVLHTGPAMTIDRIGAQNAIHSVEDEPAPHSQTTRGPAEQNHTSAFEGTHEAQPVSQPFDFFQSISALFAGQTADGNAFDLGTLLSSIFDFAGQQAKQAAPPTKTENKVGVEERVAVHGEHTGDVGTIRGSAEAEAYAIARTHSETFIDHDAVGVRGGAEASVGASAQAEGEITTDIGSIDGRVRASAEAYARVQGEAKAGTKGASAKGKAEAGVMANAEADSNIQIADGLIKGHADAKAEAGAGGQATGKVGFTYDPPQAIVSAKAESFAGARAGYSAKGGAAGLSYGIQGEVWAGVGARAEITGGLSDDGKFKLDFSLGIACGVGAMLKVSIEFDTKEFGKAVDQVFGVVGDVIGGIFGAVAGLFGGQPGDGTHAAQAITSTCQQLAPMVTKALGESDAMPKNEEKVLHDSEDSWSDGDHGTLLEGALS